MKAKTLFTTGMAAVRDQLRTWGLLPMRATTTSSQQGTTIRVLAPDPAGAMRLVGTLRREGSEFVFEYDRVFASSPGAEPISAFQELGRSYRATDLWPFFLVRIPPLRRADVRKVMLSSGLTPDQTLEILGTLARKSATNPYELQLVTSDDDAGVSRGDAPVKSSPPGPLHPAT